MKIISYIGINKRTPLPIEQRAQGAYFVLTSGTLTLSEFHAY